MNATLPRRLLQALALITVAAALSSCTTPKRKGNFSTSFDPPAKPVTNPSAVRLKLSTGAQRLYVVQGNEVLLATPCSVGTAKSPTPHGTHRIASKTLNRRRVSQPGAGYPMTFWMSFHSPAYGMHWGWVKPYPCTHGCVRLPIKAAQKVFHMVQVGTPLHVATSHPEDATIGKTLPVLDDSTLADPPMSYMLSQQVFSDAQKGKVYTY